MDEIQRYILMIPEPLRIILYLAIGMAFARLMHVTFLERETPFPIILLMILLWWLVIPIALALGVLGGMVWLVTLGDKKKDESPEIDESKIPSGSINPPKVSHDIPLPYSD